MNLPLTPVRFLRYSERQFPRKTAIVCGDLRLSYAEFGDRVSRLAGTLRDVGAKPGDRVAFLSLNCHRLLEAYYGVLEAGGILLPPNIRLAASELAYILNDSGAAVLFLEEDFVGLVDSFRQDLHTVRSFIQLGGKPEAAWVHKQNYDQMLAAATPSCRTDDFRRGRGGGNVLHQWNQRESKRRNAYASKRVPVWDEHCIAQSCWGTTKRCCTPFPYFTPTDGERPTQSRWFGGTHVMLPRFVPEEVFRLIEREHVRQLNLVPIMATTLMNSPARSKYDLSSVDWAAIGVLRLPNPHPRRGAGIRIHLLFGIWTDGMLTHTLHRRAENGHATYRRRALCAASDDGLGLRRV